MPAYRLLAHALGDRASRICQANRARYTTGAILVLLAWSTTAAEAQSPKRRVDANAIAAARSSLQEAIARVSRNPAAFLQELRPGSGCSITMVSARAEGTDSLHESSVVDAGHLATRMRMSIAPTGGVILFTYAQSAAATPVARRRGTSATALGAPEAVREFVVLVAETSNQPDVQAFTKSWNEFVGACGGDISS